jgi:hypothetical protein
MMLTKTNPKLTSLNLDHSLITIGAIQALEKILKNPSKKIVNLSLNYCFFDGQALYHLCNGLNVNKTLVTLSLAGNGLSPMCGVELIKSLKVKITSKPPEQYLPHFSQLVQKQS